MSRHRRNRRLVPVLALIALTVIPAVAQGTTVRHLGTPRGALIHVVDADGVSDRLQASGTAATSVTVRSIGGAAIGADRPCTQASPTQVGCPGGTALVADLGGATTSSANGLTSSRCSTEGKETTSSPAVRESM